MGSRRNDRAGWQANLPPRWLNDANYRSLSAEAWTLFTWTLIWGVDQENDGIVGRRDLPFIASPTLSRDEAGAAAVELVDAGLWEETETGFVVANWESSQVTTAEIETRRAEWREKNSRRSLRESSTDTPGVTPGVRDKDSERKVPLQGRQERNEGEEVMVTANWKSKRIPNVECTACGEPFESPDPERVTVCSVQDAAHENAREAVNG